MIFIYPACTFIVAQGLWPTLARKLAFVMPVNALIYRLRHPTVAQFIKYGIVGAGNTLLSVAVILALGWLGLWHIAAYAIGYGAGAINGYRMNRSWTFRAGPSHRTLVFRYFVVQAIALVASTFLVYLLVDVASLNKILGQLLAVAVAVAGGFLANRWWTFADIPPAAATQPAAP
jgi:putative flippase GtrA